MIEIKNLDFGYKKQPVFKNISLDFEKGNIYGLLGENGVGKTSLLKLISGLQKPTAGTCEVDGFTSFDRDPDFLQNIVLLPDKMPQLVKVTPEKYICDIGVFYPKYDADYFIRLANEFEVDIKQRFEKMSFGQQKKAFIACMLSLGTDYILLDEPTNGLDIPSKAIFRRIISQRSNDDTTIIISTHQVKDVENLIDPITIITHNNVLLHESVSAITEKIYFEYGGPQRDDALYSETTPSGRINVMVNKIGEESLIDIEALFKAVLNNTETIKKMFK